MVVDGGLPWAKKWGKTKLCRNWAAGKCGYANVCLFAHGERERQVNRLASSRPAYPRIASPCLALPRLASPCLTLPRLASPCLALHQLAQPFLALPGLTSPLTQACCVQDAISELSKSSGNNRNSNSGSSSSSISCGPNLYKTGLCWGWARDGRCVYGGHCAFAHGHEERKPLILQPVEQEQMRQLKQQLQQRKKMAQEREARKQAREWAVTEAVAKADAEAEAEARLRVDAALDCADPASLRTGLEQLAEISPEALASYLGRSTSLDVLQVSRALPCMQDDHLSLFESLCNPHGQVVLGFWSHARHGCWTLLPSMGPRGERCALLHNLVRHARAAASPAAAVTLVAAVVRVRPEAVLDM